MPTLLRIPEIASDSTHAVLQAWTKSPGDAVTAGECLAEIETDKAVVELVAEHSGTMGKLLVQPGAEVEIASVIGELLMPGEEAQLPRTLESASPKAPSALAPESVSPDTAGTAGRLFVSPIARRIARELMIDLKTVKGSGPHGRILRKDVEAAPAGRQQSEVPAMIVRPDPDGGLSSAACRDVPHTGMRRTLARRLTESKASIPHFYLTARCAMDRLLALRAEVNEAASRKLSINDFVVRATAVALKEVPEANVGWTDNAIRHYSAADISVAVSVEGGLFTPVIRSAESKTLSAISAEISELASRARSGSIAPQDYHGGSFSVSNLGMFGVEEFAAIINPPQSAILAVGAVQKGVTIQDDAVKIATIMTCTLSVDHRAIDGAVAARWLGCFKRLLENPLALLV